ncbi:MAG: hypothetical protein ACYTEQ_14740 [Planctomycetota bacterium]|jgi:hypothetical protein
MADTSYLRRVVEPYLLNWAGKRLGTTFTPGRESVGKNSDGERVHYAFDGVSEDGKIGVCVSASASYKTGQMRKLFMDATLLNRARRFRRRIMVFVEKHVWDGFKNQCDGLVDLDRIEPLICSDLPQDMRAKIEEIYKASAEEVGDRSGRGIKVPGRRR